MSSGLDWASKRCPTCRLAVVAGAPSNATAAERRRLSKSVVARTQWTGRADRHARGWASRDVLATLVFARLVAEHLVFNRRDAAFTQR